MFTNRRWPFGPFVMAFLTLVTGSAWGQVRPTNIELAQLPKFCYGQGQVPNATGPEFNLPASCGPGMNHYCSGLTHLIRAKASGGKGRTQAELGLAENDIRYTEEWIRNFPDCPLRDHVAASRAEVNGLRSIYGGKPAAKQSR